MNQLIFAFAILSGTLAVALLLGGYISLADADDGTDQNGQINLIDSLFFGGICRSYKNWSKNSESRVCIYLGVGFGVVAIVLLMMHKV